MYYRISDVIMRYTQEAITTSGESLDFPVKCNRRAEQMKAASSMEQVISLMRQSSTGMNLISRRAADQCLIDGYLYMKKGE